MKKIDFVTMIMATIGGLMASVGMCMCLLPEWNAFAQGVGMGVAGVVVLLVMVIVRRKMQGKRAFRIDSKTVGGVLIGIGGALLLGLGLCLVMVWNMLVWGILVGIAGIVALLCLLPYCKGIKE